MNHSPTNLEKEIDIIIRGSDMMSTGFRFTSLLFIVLFISSITEHSNALKAGECVYTLNVKTGTVKNAGTDSRISVTLANAGGSSIMIPNLVGSGVMQSGHDYFENGNLDFFVFDGPCIPSMCRITVTSDGTGNKPGWYLGYVDVTTTGPNIPRTQTSFQMNQWLAIDSAPYQLSTSRDKCGAPANFAVRPRLAEQNALSISDDHD